MMLYNLSEGTLVAGQARRSSANKINYFFCLAMTVSLDPDFSNTMQQLLVVDLLDTQSSPAMDLSLIKIIIDMNLPGVPG